ncbi:MAG: murein biosynthesis integral membrane protein MurJ, partial [Desulfobulbaceae bacterium]|nr:murein biosynthesis integral membrane protein MurJ [Desulfobulbaceae bacterium]
AMICNFLFLSVVLYKKLSGYSLSYLFEGIGKVFFASIIMTACLKVLLFCGENFFNQSILLQIVGVFVYIATAVAVYGALLYLLKVKEISLIIDKLKQRFAG